jgi:hypothetical protein
MRRVNVASTLSGTVFSSRDKGVLEGVVGGQMVQRV